MTENQFVYWLQGFAELNGDTPPSKDQWDSIREHLALQFNKVTQPVVTPTQDQNIEIQKIMKQYDPSKFHATC